MGVEPLDLDESDRRALEMGRMLTDKHMHAANTMLSTQFPTLLGLQSTLLVQTAGFDNMDLDFGGGYLLEGTI